MENNEEEVNMGQHSIKWGVTLGLIAIIFVLVLYLIDITLLVKSWVGLVSLVISIVVLIYAGRDYRAKLGGYMSFKQAFLHAFIIVVVSSFLSILFNILLYNVIDPGIVPILVEGQMNATMKAMEAFGGDSSQLMEGMEEGFRENFTVLGQAKAFLWSLLISAVFAAIIGAINKKKNQEEEF